jgi:hypothetical protein
MRLPSAKSAGSELCICTRLLHQKKLYESTCRACIEILKFRMRRLHMRVIIDKACGRSKSWRARMNFELRGEVTVPGDLKWSDVAALAQVVIVVIGVVISILIYYWTRKVEAVTRRIEAAKPFLELQQSRYTEALTMAAILSNPETHSNDEMTEARKRFLELYAAELSMVEAPAVEAAMESLAAGGVAAVVGI